MHKSALGRVLNQVQRRVLKAVLRDHKAQAVGIHVSGAGEETPVNAKRLCGSSPEHQMLKIGTGGGAFVGGGGEGGFSDISAHMGKVPMQSTKSHGVDDPSSPGNETFTAISEAREIMARLQEATET